MSHGLNYICLRFLISDLCLLIDWGLNQSKTLDSSTKDSKRQKDSMLAPFGPQRERAKY